MGAWCSVDSCVASCANCAVYYANAVLDKASARCCASLGPGGSCVGPLPGDAPYNPPYGFPNNGPGALIVEGPIPYPNGPELLVECIKGGRLWLGSADAGRKDGQGVPGASCFGRLGAAARAACHIAARARGASRRVLPLL